MCLISFSLGYFVYNKFHHKEIRHIPINDSITINVLPILPKDLTIKKSYVGNTVAINQVEIKPYVNGYLKKININEGDTVVDGDLLLTIEPSEYKAKLNAAEADVLQAKASFEYNKNYYDRVLKAGKKSFSDIERDDAKNNFHQAEAKLKNALANLKLAEVDYNYTIIKAPISGLIGNYNLSVGEYVSPENGALLDIVQTNPIRVVFSLTDVEYLNLIKQNNTPFKYSVIKLKIANGNEFKYNGKFKYTDNKINKATNSLAVYVDFRNDDNELLPNNFVTVEIYNTLKDIIIVDKSLIRMKENGNFLLIAKNNKIESHLVNILAEKDTFYAIENNFDKNDFIILDNVDEIKQGTELKFNIVEKI
jgi:membrane fusion protein (multidrug efflux system)